MRVLFGLVLAGISLVAGAAELRDVRVWASPDGTRVVFDLSQATPHTLLSLENPSRVVIDLADAHRAQQLATQLEGKGLVKRVRTGAYTTSILRVVLDLDVPVKSKSFVLQPNESYGYRVVVDLSSAAAPVPATAVASAAPAAPAAVPAPMTAPAQSPNLQGPPTPKSMTPAPAPKSAVPAPATPAPQAAAKPIVVAIDAGHGGEDPGARGRHGLLEKDVCLDLARRLATMVDREPGLKAVLIRDGDYYVGLRDRIDKAHAANADLFISIHANSFKDPTVRGTAVYVLSPKGATSEHAQILESRENMSDLIGGVDSSARDDTTAAVLVDIFQTSAMEASHDAGGRLLHALARVNVLQKPRVQQAAFVVLKSAAFPSVLVETAFLTNDREEKLLGDGNYQDNMARSMLEGIKGYFKAYRPSQQMAQSPVPSAQPVSLQGAIAR